MKRDLKLEVKIESSAKGSVKYELAFAACCETW